MVKLLSSSAAQQAKAETARIFSSHSACLTQRLCASELVPPEESSLRDPRPNSRGRSTLFPPGPGIRRISRQRTSVFLVAHPTCGSERLVDFFLREEARLIALRFSPGEHGTRANHAEPSSHLHHGTYVACSTEAARSHALASFSSGALVELTHPTRTA